MPLQSRSQRQAQAVYNCITARLIEYNKHSDKNTKQFKEDYECWCQRFPSFVLQNGLLQTLVFILKKDKKEEKDADKKKEKPSKLFLDDFNQARNRSLEIEKSKSILSVSQKNNHSTVITRNKNSGDAGNKNFESIEEFIKYLQATNVSQYQQETRLALELSLWFKRYAQSVLADKGDN